MQYQLGFIGCGNMGGALVQACAKHVDGKKIALCDFMPEKAVSLAEKIGGSVLSAKEIAEKCAFVVLGVKPQNIESTIAEIADVLTARNDVTVISMAVSISTSAIQKYIGKALPVIRIMPNTPALVGEGMILYATKDVDERAEKAFLDDFSLAGTLDKLEEDLIDPASALSGCGPAFVYAFAEALANGAEKCGVPKDKAVLYASQTIKGAGEMLLAFGNPSALKKAVCSPNGTTLAGIQALEENDFERVSESAVLGAYKRALELKK